MAESPRLPDDLASEITSQHDALLSGGVLDPSAKGFVDISKPELPQVSPPPQNPGSFIPPSTGGYNKPATNSFQYAQDLAKHIENADMYAQDQYKYGKQRGYNADYTGANFDRYYTYGSTWDKFGFSPWRDNEKLYNENSSWSENFSRGMTGFMKTAGVGFSSMLPWNAWSDDMTDSEMSKTMQSAHAIYGDTRGGFWAGFNNLSIDAGISMGIVGELALEEGIIWAGSTLAAPFTGGSSWGAAAGHTAASLSKAKRVWDLASAGAKIRRTYEGIKGLTDINKARQFYNYVKSGKPLMQAGKMLAPQTLREGTDLINSIRRGDKIHAMATASRGFGAFYRDARTIAAARSESKMEGGMVYHDLVSELGDEFYKEKGRQPNAQEWEEIYMTADNAAQETFLLNMPALLVSNHIVFDKALKGWPGMKTLSKEASEGLSGRLIAKEAFWKNADKKAWDVVKQNWGTPLKSLTKAATWKPKNLFRTSLSGLATYTKANLTEALQEQYQEAASAAIKDYYKTIHANPMKAGYNEFLGFFGDRAAEQFTTAEGWRTFTSGFLIGGMIQFPQHVLFKSVPEQFQKLTNRKQMEENRAKKEEWTNSVLNAMNAVTADPFRYFNDPNSRFVNQRNKAATMDQAGLDDDQYTYQNAVDESVFDHLNILQQSGKMDVVTSYLADMKKLSGEELQQAFGPYEGTEQEAKSYYDKQIDNLLERADYIKKRSDYINSRFANPFDYHRFSMDKEPEKRMSEKNNYLAFEEAKKHAIYSSYAFDRTVERMNSILNDSITDKVIGKASSSDFSILFEPDPESATGITAEIRNLKQEIQTYSKGNAQEKKIAERKRKKLEALEELNFSINHFTESLERKDKEAVSQEAVQEGKNLLAVQAGTQVRAKTGQEFVVEKVVGPWAYTTVDGKIKKFKRKNLEVLTAGAGTAEQDELDFAQADLFNSYNNYLRVIAQASGDYAFDDKVKDGFLKLRDFYRLKHDSGNLAWAVNALHNPLYFTQHAERAADIFKSLYNQRIAENKRLYEQYVKMKDNNDLLNRIFELGAYMHPDDVKGLIDEASVPSRFFDAVSHQPIAPTDPRYGQIIELIENWEGFTGRVLTDRPITGAGIDAAGYDKSARGKFKSDNRTYADYGKQYNFFGEGTSSTTRPLSEVLRNVVESKYASRREKLVARRLMTVAKPEAMITFSSSLSSPSQYDFETDVIKIDPRYSSSDFTGGDIPFEHVLMHEIIHKFTAEGYNTDTDFQGKIDGLFTTANEAWDSGSFPMRDSLQVKPGQKPYGLNSQQEFIAEAMTNDKFQAFLNQIPYENTTRTTWQEFLDSVKKLLHRILGVRRDDTVLDEAVGVITSKIEEVAGETSTTAPIPEPSTGVMFTNKTPIQELPAELQETLLSIYRDQNAAMAERGDDMLDAFALEKSADQILSSTQFKNFIGSGIWPKVASAISNFNVKTGRKTQPSQKVEPKPETGEFKASVPLIITRDMRQQLYDLAYSREDVNKMTPQEANRIIASGISKNTILQQEENLSKAETQKRESAKAALEKQVAGALASVQNMQDLERFQDYMRDILRDDTQSSLIGLTGDELDKIMDEQMKKLATSFNFDSLNEGETVTMQNPKYGNMTIISKTDNEVKLRPFGEEAGAVLILSKKQVDEERMIKFRYSPGMEDVQLTEALSEEQIQESNKAVSTAQQEDIQQIAEDINEVFNKSNQEVNKDFLDSLDNCSTK